MRVVIALLAAVVIGMWCPRMYADQPLVFSSNRPDPYPGITAEEFAKIADELDAAAAGASLGVSTWAQRYEPYIWGKDPNRFNPLFNSPHGGLYTSWVVVFDVDQELPRLREAHPDVKDDRRLLLDWYRAANRELLRRTQSVYEAHGLGEAWEPEHEFEVLFHHPIGSSHVRVEKRGGSTLYHRNAARFLGERLISLRDQPEPMDPPSRAPTPERRTITVEIVPKKAQWSERETITGSIVVTNTSGKTVRVKDFANYPNESVRISHDDGSALERWPIRTSICGGTGYFLGQYTAWGPGESHSISFFIATEPDRFISMRAPPGLYRLEYILHDWPDYVDVTVKNATIEVVPADHAP